jgi:hypothetical protein
MAEDKIPVVLPNGHQIGVVPRPAGFADPVMPMSEYLKRVVGAFNAVSIVKHVQKSTGDDVARADRASE